MPRRDHLREGARLREFRILVDQESHVDVLAQVVGDDEALGGRGLDELRLEVDLLRASLDLLELLASQFGRAVADLGLSLGLRLPLALDDAILISRRS